MNVDMWDMRIGDGKELGGFPDEAYRDDDSVNGRTGGSGDLGACVSSGLHMLARILDRKLLCCDGSNGEGSPLIAKVPLFAFRAGCSLVWYD